MKSLSLYECSFPLSASKLGLTGDLVLNSRIALPYKDNVDYSASILNFTSITGVDPNALSWNRIVFDYSQRDCTLLFTFFI